MFAQRACTKIKPTWFRTGGAKMKLTRNLHAVRNIPRIQILKSCESISLNIRCRKLSLQFFTYEIFIVKCRIRCRHRYIHNMSKSIYSLKMTTPSQVVAGGLFSIQNISKCNDRICHY